MLDTAVFNGIFQKQRGTREKRRHVRHTGAPLSLMVEGQKYRTIDWSQGGFRIAAFARALTRGDRIEGTVSGLGVAKPGEFQAEVVWTSDFGEAGLRILEISPVFFLAMTNHTSH